MKILIAVVGNSPAILTETVWALAHRKSPWIPDQVVAITTTDGREKIQNQLIQGRGWEKLVSALQKEKKVPVGKRLLFGSSESIRVIGNGKRDFSDIFSPEENCAAADFILSVLRQYTEDSETEIAASIAGGRKTMSALMLACMSLLGREKDFVCHVLANEEFIAGNRGFLFPFNPKETKAANLQLSEVPFIRVRAWYEQESAELPASYSHMVSLFRKAVPREIEYPKISINPDEGSLKIDGCLFKVTPQEFLFLYTMITSFLHQGKAVPDWGEFQENVNIVMKGEFSLKCGWHEKVLGTGYRTKSWTKVASMLRKKLGSALYVARLIPSPGDPVSYPSCRLIVERTS